MLGAHCRRPVGRAHLVAVAGFMLLAGCTGSNKAQTVNLFDGFLNPPAKETARRSSPAAREHCSNPAECKVVLKTMIENPDRGWIGTPQPADTYANGTRLFAYRALRKKLTCGELGMAVRELHGVTRKLNRPVSGMSPDQVSRTRDLSSQVRVELVKERAGRCKT